MLASLPDSERELILREIGISRYARTNWAVHARAEQFAPKGDWRTWVYLAGRGAGKTRAGGECMRRWVESGQCRRLHFVAPTASDVRDVMVEGESGILAISHPRFMPVYEPSKRRLTWPNGSTAMLFSADKPDRLRGPQCDGLWCDEVASWRYPDAWDMAMFGLRLGSDPRTVVTTTPRPTKLIKSILANPTTVQTRGSTYDNQRNLAPAFVEQIIQQYEGTRLGRQEIYAEILDDNPNALWNRAMIDDHRISSLPDPDKGFRLSRVVVAIDPSATATGDETGIVVCAIGNDRFFYVLEDFSRQGSPDQWARAAVAAYEERKADRIIYEANQGGDMVAHTIRTVNPHIPLTAVHASRGKTARAEPIAALYEQGRVRHVGTFPKLEDQMCEWDASSNESPDRLDALVWGLTELSQKHQPEFFSRSRLRI